jgi:hypothetical protein
METSYYKSVFDLAARIGSLEGYLYVGKDVEAEYLPGWLENINRGFNDLESEVKREIEKDYLEVLKKVAAYLERVYGEADQNASKARRMLESSRESGSRG